MKTFNFIIVTMLLAACTPAHLNGVQIGPVGPTGAQGVPGTTGPEGSEGPTGSAGQNCSIQANNGQSTIVCPDGSQTTVPSEYAVQFCTGYTEQYPSVFPEFGLCLNGILYGVYWTGSEAFLAELAPGAYSSTSPNGCTFTVGNNCEVTH